MPSQETAILTWNNGEPLTRPPTLALDRVLIMVEGPGATRNRRKAQAAVGCAVEVVALPSTCDVSKSTALNEHLNGCILCDAFSVGKELFLIFLKNTEEVAVRLHFGMNGCLYCAKSISVPPWKQEKEATIRITLIKPRRAAVDTENTITNFYAPVASAAASAASSDASKNESDRITLEARESTVSGIVSATAARSKLARLACRDACSSSFDARQVFTVLRDAGVANASLMICDAVLNQDLYPGVGNIIKVEGFHRAKVDPRRTVATLSDAELRRVVLHCRKYSMGWLEQGRAPTKMVYNRTTCGTCNTLSVSMQKMGGGGTKMNGPNHAYMSRTTFWCRLCQPCGEMGGSNAGPNHNETQHAMVPPIPSITIACPQHGGCLLRRVRKSDSPNLSRIFRICKVRQCQYFEWADGRFPSCRCRRKAILRVSKTERSGGRWFLSCSRGDKRGSNHNNNPEKTAGCGFFEWAKPEVLAPLGSALTPLL